MNNFQKNLLNYRRKLFFWLVASLFSTILASQESSFDSIAIQSDDPVAEPILGINSPLKTPDVSSPKATLFSFIDNMNASYQLLMEAHDENLEIQGLYIDDSVKPKVYEAERYFEKASYSLDLSSYPPSIRKNLGYTRAIMLKEILDRIELPQIEEVPGAEPLDLIIDENSKPSFYTIPNTEITLVRIAEGNQQGKYLFSAETVSRLKEFYLKSKHLSYRSDENISKGFYTFYAGTPGKLMPPGWSGFLPEWTKIEVLSQTIWQWIALIFCFILSLFVLSLIYKYLILPKNENINLRNTIFLIIVLGITIILNVIISDQINITGSLLIALKVILESIFWLISALLSYNILVTISEYVVKRKHINKIGLEATYTRAVFTILAILIASSIILYGLSELGIDSVSLITGVGIGGIAIALAARSTLENVIASFTIFADKPYRVGDRVKIMDHNGTIETIGIRSTQIRLLTGPIVSIPNEKMASIEIENIQKRPFLRREFDIRIKYESSRDIVEKSVEIIKDVLSISDIEGDEFHPNLAINSPDYPPRVYFNKINDDSFNIYIIYWHFPPKHWEFMEHSEAINFQIIKRLKEANIDFAFPTQSLQLSSNTDMKESIEKK
ncbi:MAG: mechanosensitive ion channel family protein [Eudoraea sp.]|uniref:mechanosensitive ion channel family protein n=1 Tax=Eudoraea sp. TaxID=1979955 RepID=UPI0032665F52